MDVLIDDKELNVLLNEIYVYTGFDFRDYSVPSLKRRVSKCMREEKLHRPAEFRQKVLVSPQSLNRLLQALPVHVTAMFRDAGFYLFFKQQVIPWLKTYPFVRLWIAGCSTGEEVYSVAILLEEAGLLDRTLLYATDFNLVVLNKAKSGLFPVSSIRQYSRNYFEAGGSSTLSDYYTIDYNDRVKFDSALVKNVVWSRHNLTTDHSFNEFNVIFCRNVLIYFNKELQNHVHELLYGSLAAFGILGLGNKETIEFTPRQRQYEVLDSRQKFYRKMK